MHITAKHTSDGADNDHPGVGQLKSSPATPEKRGDAGCAAIGGVIYLADCHPLVVGEDVGHLPGVEHVVDVFHERLVDDLGV